MNILTIAIFLNINFFCEGLLDIEPDCANEIIQCYLDDAFTIEECKQEYLWDKFKESIKVNDGFSDE